MLAGAGVYIFLDVKSGLDASLDASLHARAVQYARLASRRDDASLRRALAVEGEPAQLLDRTGRVLIASPRATRASLLNRARLRRALAHEVRFERHEAARLIALPVSRHRVIVASTSMVQRERALEELSSVLLIGAPLILLLSSSAGYLVASGALRPVERMRRRAAEISAATPDARLPLPRTRDELSRLGETLNEMLARLRAAADHERAFLATASHELRTPLAILKAEVELSLHESAREPQLRAALASIGEEADRLIRLAEDLLVLARGQDGTLPLAPRSIRLHELAARVTDRFSTISDDGLRADVPRDLVVDADALRLEQALGNLIDNALRHGAEPITISARRERHAVELHVVDSGAGFDDRELAHAFEHAGSGRARAFGLGLSIVAAIARAHGGSVGAANAEGGADVWLALPVPDQPREAAYVRRLVGEAD